MRYLFDTNICIYLLNKSDEGLIRRVSALTPTSVAVSTLTVAELVAGVVSLGEISTAMSRIAEFLSSFQIIPFDVPDAEAYGSVYPVIGRTGKRTNAIDGLLAAQAIARGLSLVTNDRRFPKIPGMKLHTWP